MYLIFQPYSCHILTLYFGFADEKVIRGGRRVEISIYDIVVGDVIPLNIGNQVRELLYFLILLIIPNDCISLLLLSSYLLCLGPCWWNSDHRSFSCNWWIKYDRGEQNCKYSFQSHGNGILLSYFPIMIFFLQVHKDSKDPFLMSGCKVADGSGTMLVIYTPFPFHFVIVCNQFSNDCLGS